MNKPSYSVRLLCIDEDGESTTILPFVPFVGLMLRLPWRGGDYAPVDEVYWDDKEKRFHLYFNEEEA